MATRFLLSCSAGAAVAAVMPAGPLIAAEPEQQAAAPLTLACPARLVTNQSASAAPGWEVQRSSKSNGRLSRAGFYSGPVIENAQLRPNGGGRRGRITANVHNFTGDSTIYFGCFYQGTDVVLSKALPAHIRQCTSTSDGAKPAADDVITCR